MAELWVVLNFHFFAQLWMSGGLTGFDKVMWDVVEHKDGECPSVTFQYHSKDGEEGTLISIFVLTEDLHA